MQFDERKKKYKSLKNEKRNIQIYEVWRCVHSSDDNQESLNYLRRIYNIQASSNVSQKTALIHTKENTSYFPCIIIKFIPKLLNIRAQSKRKYNKQKKWSGGAALNLACLPASKHAIGGTPNSLLSRQTSHNIEIHIHRPLMISSRDCILLRFECIGE